MTPSSFMISSFGLQNLQSSVFVFLVSLSSQSLCLVPPLFQDLVHCSSQRFFLSHLSPLLISSSLKSFKPKILSMTPKTV